MKSIKTQILSIFTAFSLAVGSLCLPDMGVLPSLVVPASADGEWSKFTTGVTTLGTTVIGAPKAAGTNESGWVGDYVYYGQYNSNPVKYRVLTPSTTAFGGTTMLLDCDTTLFEDAFRDEWQADDANVWTASDLYKVLNTNDDSFLKTSFTGAEAAAIAESTVNHDESAVKRYLRPADLGGEKIFLLDVEEATNRNYGYETTGISNNTRLKSKFTDENDHAYGWWLRSPDTYTAHRAGYVYGGRGDILYYLNVINDDVGVSPAFNINLTSVIFSSVINPGATGTYGKEYKLTLKDSNTTIAAGDISRDGDTVTVPYTVTDSNTTDGIAADTVSVLITNAAGTAIKYYAPLTGTFAMTGASGTFDLPATYAATDKVYILAEDTHEGNAARYLTDYASDKVEITIPVPSYLTAAIAWDDSDVASGISSVDNAVDAGNPHTGVSGGFGLLAVCTLTAGAAVALKKRRK